MSKVQELNNSVYKPQKQNPTAVDTGNLYSSDNRFGLTQRPIDQKKQVRNKLLPTVNITADESVASASVEDLTTSLAVSNVVGRYNWKVDSWAIYAPEYWVYQCSGYITVDWSVASEPTTVYRLLGYIEKNDSTNEVIGQAIVTAGFSIITMSWIFILDKWDYIKLRWDNWYTWAMDFQPNINITKIA